MFSRYLGNGEKEKLFRLDGIEWVQSLPEKDGKYIVKTKSTILRTEYVMYAHIHTDEKGKRHWSFKNQTFVEYLKEEW